MQGQIWAVQPPSVRDDTRLPRVRVPPGCIALQAVVLAALLVVGDGLCNINQGKYPSPFDPSICWDCESLEQLTETCPCYNLDGAGYRKYCDWAQDQCPDGTAKFITCQNENLPDGTLFEVSLRGPGEGACAPHVSLYSGGEAPLPIYSSCSDCSCPYTGDLGPTGVGSAAGSGSAGSGEPGAGGATGEELALTVIMEGFSSKAEVVQSELNEAIRWALVLSSPASSLGQQQIVMDSVCKIADPGCTIEVGTHTDGSGNSERRGGLLG
eukprot:CAMPEP_0174919196 /NCGR_PEP_ID=MMETSP1355-20121228/3531_1 /TAXON_ID=464990 /ORGANISM="Hemiselmis tepida, Strain CCMP443" /LENGTH=267 /DNA_ID=CAMNT_0016164409 /DNA_START=420 /DNA_END=1220 /DNA_ORIENTATION=-